MIVTHRGTIILAGIIGIVVLCAAGWLWYISLSNIPLYRFNQHMMYDGPVTLAQLEELEASSGYSALQHMDGNALEYEALVRLILAKEKGVTNETGRALLARAEKDLTIRLQHSPANPLAWLRLAYIRVLKDGPTQGVADALALSVMTGPYESSMAVFRFKLALLVWDFFTVEELPLLQRQVYIIWHYKPKDLVALAKGQENYTRIKSALAHDPQAVSQFTKMVMGKGP